jgi:hypothetical protein
LNISPVIVHFLQLGVVCLAFLSSVIGIRFVKRLSVTFKVGELLRSLAYLADEVFSILVVLFENA